MKEQELNGILKKNKHLGIASGFKPAFKAGFPKRSSSNQNNPDGAWGDMESDLGDGQVGEGKIQVKYSGIAEVTVTFYRLRLADSSRNLSEKAELDGLVYAGLLAGDSEKHVRLIDGGQHKVHSKEEERTEITILYPDFDPDDMHEEVPWVKGKQKTKGKK